MDRVCSLLRIVDLGMEVTCNLVMLYLALLPLGQPEKEQIEAGSTIFDLKHAPVECVSPENDSKSKLSTCS